MPSLQTPLWTGVHNSSRYSTLSVCLTLWMHQCSTFSLGKNLFSSFYVLIHCISECVFQGANIFYIGDKCLHECCCKCYCIGFPVICFTPVSTHRYGGTLQSIAVKLPITLNKFFQPTEMTSQEFFQRWKQLGA